MSTEEEQPAQQSQQTIVVNSLFIGQLEEFVPGSNLKHYVERVEMFFEVSNVSEQKKVLTILTLLTYLEALYLYEDRRICRSQKSWIIWLSTWIQS